MKYFWISLSGLLLLTSSCAMFGERKPAAARETMLSGIYGEIQNATSLISTDSAACSKEYENIYNQLFNIAGSVTIFERSDLQSIDEDIKESFLTRLALKDSFNKFSLNGTSAKKCLQNAQDVFKALRYVEDYLIEIRMERAANSPMEYVNLKGSFPYLLINPKYKSDFSSYEDLKSGDVILSRGNAYSSAAIARIAQSDYQFSHLSFVYKDQETKEIFTSEAHIEVGSITAPIIDHINEKNVRSVVFRYNDNAIAEKASQLMYERVTKAQNSGKAIEYDFSMNYRDDSKLFCSEVIGQGFKLADPKSDYIPLFKSQFTTGMIPFLNTIGVPVTKENIDTLNVFAPGDIQFDPRFEIVAEWRNPKKLEESRYKDFILTKLFERMDKEGYQIDPSLKMDVESRAFWLLRRTPLIKKFLSKKFSLTMNPAQMELFMALDNIGETFYKNLEVRAIEFDHPMTPKEIYQVIDEFIAKDYEVFKKYKKGLDNSKPAFHLLFHP